MMAYSIKGKKFIIEDYNNGKIFASFFPGITGLWGKPLWCFYTNRGQGISSFGVRDKDGAILEFEAANKAYQHTTLKGFRTFIKINQQFYEPFSYIGSHEEQYREQKMIIDTQTLTFIEENKKLGLKVIAEYFVTPNENIPSLSRRLKIENINNKDIEVEILDGLPGIKPFGLTDFLLKNMSRLSEALFSGTAFVGSSGIPVYKLEIENNDSPETAFIQSGNFYFGVYYQANKKKNPVYIVDPEVVFGGRTDFVLPENFISKSFKADTELRGSAKTPMAMGYIKEYILRNSSLEYISILGTAHNIKVIPSFAKKIARKNYFDEKKQESRFLTDSISNSILTISGFDKFDTYASQTYIDNLLRGGYPVEIGGKKKIIYYAYSRIHGDMEREYNNFVLEPEFFTQGNGNYRDVVQNRRSDIYFNSEVKESSIMYFFNLIQLDGYNPLRVLGVKFKVKNKRKFAALFSGAQKQLVEQFLDSNPEISIGRFFDYLDNHKIRYKSRQKQIVDNLIEYSDILEKAEHGEGFWSDHWHYNLDLLESYEGIFPDKLETLLLERMEFVYYDSAFRVLPREEKYMLFEQFPVQMNSVVKDNKKEKMILQRKASPYFVHDKNNQVYQSNLLVKLLVIIVNKFASLDPYGQGIEMEADKPNWDDALNGLPGLFGSSLSETLELKRMILFVLRFLGNINLKNRTVDIPVEVSSFLYSLYRLSKKEYSDFLFWEESHAAKEKYRARVFFGIEGKVKEVPLSEIYKFLRTFETKLQKGIEKSFNKQDGLYNTYFYYEPVQYEKIKKQGQYVFSEKGYPLIKIRKFKQKILPHFLEGQVHALKILQNKEISTLHKRVMKSTLYDRKMKMLKVNTPLIPVNYRLGRISSFPRGWLENESIWLHMEYKYLLELLKQGMVQEFYKLAETSLVPFLNPDVYGRSIFENVSFIVSSGYPEKSKHGQGFVARLSGSTAEFLSIWVEMTSGSKPFFVKDEHLVLKFLPKLKADFFTKKKLKSNFLFFGKKRKIILESDSFAFKFLGQVLVIYHNPERKDTFGKGGVSAVSFLLHYVSGKTKVLNNTYIPYPYADDVRNGKIDMIKIELR